MGPYAYKENQWVSYDDKDMIRQKAKFMRQLGLGGGMIWALDLDDFKDHCGEGVHPLLTELQSVLADPPNGSDQGPDIPAIEQQQQPTTSAPPQPPLPSDSDAEIIEEIPNEESAVDNTNAEPSSTSPSQNSDYKVVCYCK